MHPSHPKPAARRAVALLLACAVLPSLAHADPPAPELRVAGPAETVFEYARDRCDNGDIPDAPARAVRLRSGEVRLYAPHWRNRALSGPSLLALRPDCRVVFAGAERDDPAAFDDRSWIAAVHTPDGTTIHAVVHTEFQGNRRPALCPTGRYMECWYNALTYAVSHDGGASFRRPAGPALVAALPYRYEEVVGRHRGYFNPSSIVTRDGRLYMFAFATAAFAQRPGNCLLRTADIADPGAWRGWDGAGFNARFIDPYRDADASPERHVCAPVDPSRLRWPVTSLVRVAGAELYIALMMNSGRDGGVFAAASRDLLRWSEPVRVLAGSGPGAWRCGDPPPLAYPSLLDPASGSANFETVGAAAMLFLTRFNPRDCRIGMDRDLIRVPVLINPTVSGDPIKNGPNAK